MSVKSHIIATILLFFLTWLFVGIYQDDEFYESNLFIKYKPTFKVFFYSPTGMSDLQLQDLTTEKKSEEIEFQKFIINQHLQTEKGIKMILPYLIILLTFIFFTLTVFKIMKNRKPIKE